ncbi:methyl-accepting chemotaxis protein [Paenibacillus sp. YYML68]|uniref:methyl-accepting chemotaxis protein n=1 Tax=Paenibacillus sp. YYML68 TaxID=2909250 RepID=UPI00249218BE|nr:methyl-accepting chemotaxis protein [Paenibacillus sp. YYML68]
MSSLHFRITVIFSLLILLSGSLLSYQIYTSSVELITQSLGEQARSVAEHAAKQIDLEKYKEITPEKGETTYYTELRLRLNEIREANSLKYLYTMAERKQGGSTQYVYIVDGMPLDAKGDDFSPLGKVEEELGEEQTAAFTERKVQVGDLDEDESYGALVSAYIPLVSSSGEMLGIIGADFDATKVHELLEHNRQTTLVTTGVIFIAAIVLTYLFSRLIVAPVRRLTEQIERVQGGELQLHEQAVSRSNDEIGRLAQSFQLMVEVLRGMIVELQRSVLDMRQSTHVHAESTTATMTASRYITDNVRQVTEAVEKQVKYSEETVRSMGEVGAGVQRVATSLSIAADASQEASATAQGGYEYVQEAVKQMENIETSSRGMGQDVARLAEQSEHVSQIIDVIKAISTQTSLLALNAAIEAARAGEHGRGFAVVADQVRKLAIQSEESAAAISELIEAMLASTDKVVQGFDAKTQQIESGRMTVAKAGLAFESIVAEVQRVSAQVQEVSAVSEQIAAGAEQVMAAADETDRLSRYTSEQVVSISRASGEQLDAMERMAGSTERLREMSERLEQLITQFKL